MQDQASAGRRKRWLVRSVIAVGAVLVLIVLGGLLFPPMMAKLDMASMDTMYEVSEAPEDTAAMMPVPEAAPESEYAPEVASDEGGAMSIPFGSAAYAAEIDRQIIYRADFTIEVKDVDATAASIETTVKAAGGLVSDKKVQEYTAGERTCTITVRVPAGKFDDVCETLRKCGEVLSEGIETDDVTEEFVDLEARLKNLNREEGILLELFDRPGKVTDVLQVERELSRVRGEIERLQGRLKYLKDRVNYSTITAQLYTEHAEAVRKMDKWDLGYHVLRAWRALVNVARALTYVVIYSVIVAGPFVVVVLVIWGIVRAIRRRRPGEPELPPRADEQ